MGLVALLVALDHLRWHPVTFHDWLMDMLLKWSILFFLRCQFIYKKTPKRHWTPKKVKGSLPFCPSGSKFSLFSLYGQRFPRYVPIFKIPMFGYETWPLVKIPESTLSFYPRGSKLSLFPLYGQRFQTYRPIFKIAIFGHETWPLLHLYSFYTRGCWDWAYFRSTGSSFRDSGAFSKLPYLGMKLCNWPKFQKLHIYYLNDFRIPNFILFCSTIALFPDNWGFWFLHWNFRKKIVKKIENSKFQKSQTQFCEDHWEENSGEVWKLLAVICMNSVLKVSLP